MTNQRYAIVIGEEVSNVILWDDENEFEAPEGASLVLAPEEVSIGWRLVSDKWVSPPKPEPLPEPEPDPVVVAAKNEAVAQLMGLGITEAVARTIVGLPPK